MSGLFHSLLSKKHAEPECLTAQGIAARLERMFSEAASYIIIVSPYIKLNLRLRDILGEKKKAGVDITIIHKGPLHGHGHLDTSFPAQQFACGLLPDGKGGPYRQHELV